MSRSSQKTSKPPTRKASDVDHARTYLFHGRSGSGKTTLLGDFPKPLLVLDCKDKGTDSISDMKEVEVADVEDWDRLEDWLHWLIAHPDEYRTVGIDTVSGMNEMAIQLVASKKNLKGKNAGDWGTMTKQDWGDVSRKMKNMLIAYRDLRDLGIEVVFLAQERVFNLDDEEGNGDQALTPEVGPGVSPSVAKHLNAAVDVIGSAFIRTRIKRKELGKGKVEKTEIKEYCLRVGPNPVYTTKIRKPRKIEAPEFLVDPTYQDIQDIINGDY